MLLTVGDGAAQGLQVKLRIRSRLEGRLGGIKPSLDKALQLGAA